MTGSYQFPRLHAQLARRQMRGDVLRFECVMRPTVLRDCVRMKYVIYCVDGVEQTIIGVIGARSGIERVWFG